jgi:probable S-adenosylmethionine-dependent methyltransferase, YraL family
MVSCHKFNEQSRIELLREAFEQGLNVALVSDGGTPLISDPGSRIVAEAVALGFTITPIPGPTALIHALVGSGLPCDKFVFEGFLPDKESHMKKRLMQLASDERTLVFYVPPHGIKKTIAVMFEVLGDRRVCLARELTKFFEQFIRSTLSKVADELNEENLKGEFTVVVAGGDPKEEKQVSQEVLEQFVLNQLEAGAKVKEIAAQCAKAYGVRKSDAYALAVKMSKPDAEGS